MYRRAAAMLDERHRPLNTSLDPKWTTDSTAFLYRRELRDGVEFRLFDLRDGSNEPAFDHAEFARRLASVADADVPPENLPLRDIRLASGSGEFRFEAFDREWDWSRADLAIRPVSRGPAHRVIDSPNRRYDCFLRDYNVWLTDKRSDRERPLTQDGRRHFAYGFVPECTVLSPEGGDSTTRQFALWSPDSTKLAVFQTDERSAGTLPIVDFAAPDGDRSCRVSHFRVPFPCEPETIAFRIRVIDLEAGTTATCDDAVLPAVRSLQTPIADGRVWWSGDGRTLYWIQIDRGERAARIVRFDPQTGSRGVVFEETSDTYLDFGGNLYGAPCIARVSPGELIWYSERTDWGHLYLYDLDSGALKRQITAGDWCVRDILHVDPVRREILIAGSSRDRDTDPYQRKIYKASLDREDVQLLTRDDFDHLVLTTRSAVFAGIAESFCSGCCPAGDFFVDTYGNLEQPPVSAVRDRQGNRVAEIERCAVPEPVASCVFPSRVRATGADGRTDVWCTVIEPSDGSPAAALPVVDYVYAGPQVSTAPVHLFQGFHGWRIYLEMAALASLGFTVVAIDARGTGNRSKSYRDFAYGDLRKINCLDDHAAVIRQLPGLRHRIDGRRVGILGFSAGGFAAACAVLDHAQTFRVAVSMSGNHEPLLFWSSWSERYLGLAADAYRGQANSEHASSLGGKLLLIHGLLDKGCHPIGLFRFTAELDRADRPYELFVEPETGHDISAAGRLRAWRYLTRHLSPDAAATESDNG